MIDEAEALYRAANHDVVEWRVDSFADALRSAHPTKRLFTYTIWREIQAHIVTEWEAYCTLFGITPGQGHLHKSGAIHSYVGANGNTWYPMNMGNANYRGFCNLTTLKSILGTRYGAPLFTYPPGMDAVVIDNTLWYSNYDDVNNEDIINTDEYTGSGELYRQHCREAFVETRDYVAASLGPAPLVYPNFGNLLEAERTDPDTIALIAASPKLILVEQAVRYTSTGEPNLTAESCELRWATINTLLDGTRELMLDGWVLAADPTPNKERAKLGVAAWLLMAYETGMIGRFYYAPEDVAGHSSTWEDSGFLRTASLAMGTPLSAYTIALQTAKQRVYTRTFQGGRIYLAVRKASQVGSESNDIVLGQLMRPIDVTGQAGNIASTITISIGEAIILVSAETEITIDAPIAETIQIAAPIDSTIAVEAPIDTTISTFSIITEVDGGTGQPKPPTDPPPTQE